jgi:hypothetical protein
MGCCAVTIALMMEAASTSETSVNFYQTTQRNNPEDSHPYKDLFAKYSLNTQYSFDKCI